MIQEWAFEKIKEAYDNTEDTFDETIGLVTSLEDWSIFKKRPDKDNSNAEYIYFTHKENETHLGFQFLLTGILSVYYDPTRNVRERPGFTGFPSGRKHDGSLGTIEVCRLR